MAFSFDPEGYESFWKAQAKLATSRSKIVIASMPELEGVGEHIFRGVFDLSGVSPSESWDLFERTAFPDKENRLQALLDLGHQICEKCGNVPGVIRIIATILSFKTTPEEWKHFLDVVMTSVPDPITTITDVIHWLLVRKHRSLPEQWYCIFAWCSLLPKDYTFTRDDLFHLWMANYKHKWNKDEQFQKNVAMWFCEFYESGCFLKCDGTVSYKISALGYELMKYEVGDEYCLVDSTAVEIHHKVIRHISFIVDASWEPPPSLSQAKFLKSLWLWPRKSGDFILFSKINSMLSRMQFLRALHAEAVHCERIPQFLGESEKLKYLRFGAVFTISFPDEIPLLDKLLNRNPYYSGLIDDKNRAQPILDLLVKFTSKKLTIQSEKGNELDSLKEVRYFMKSLNVQSITLSSFHGEDEKLKSEILLQTLETLMVHCWRGKKWPTDDKWLSIVTYNLVSIQFRNCRRCRQLPAFNKLPHLTSLQIGGMQSLKDILTIDENSEASSARIFYPSLKILILLDLPKFKGWSHNEGDCFPILAQVRIRGCPNLMSMPSAPMLKSLEAININAKLMKHLIYPSESTLSSSSSTLITDYVSSQESTPSPMTILEIDGCIEFDFADKGIWLAFSCLRSLKLNNIVQLVSLPDGLQCFPILERLSLCWLPNLKALPEGITELRRLTIHYCLKLTTLPNSFSSLELLDIRYCPRLSQFPESFPNLKWLYVQEICRFEQIVWDSENLVKLEIDNCQDLDYDTQSTEGNSSVRVLNGHNKLRSLKITKMESFPKSIDFEQLSELCHLSIHSCPKITALPESLCSLPALEYLYIKMSPQLEKRCKEQDGEDWHLIQHIPNVICGNQEN